MNKFMDWLQNVLMPPLAKAGNNKYLVSIRNGLVLTLPAVISGSIFLIIANIPIPAWTNFMKPYMDAMGVAVNGSFGIISLLAAIGIGYELAKALELDAINGAGLSTMAFIVASFNSKYTLDTANFASSGLFTAIVCSFISVLILNLFVKKNWVIKLPNGVPAAVSQSFVSLIPGFLVLLLFWGFEFPFILILIYLFKASSIPYYLL